MSLPPITVHIKRKATDQPVDFLHLDESNIKRQRRGTEYVFSRQTQSLSETSPTSLPAGPPVRDHEVKQNAEASKGATPQEITQIAVEASTLSSHVTVKTSQSTAGTELTQNPIDVALLRQFRITRIASSSQIIGNGIRKVQRGTLLVERKARAPIPPSIVDTTYRTYANQAINPLRPFFGRVLKKPGQSARIVSSGSGTTTAQSSLETQNQPYKNIRLPSGADIPWDINDEKLAAEMEAITLQEMTKRQPFTCPPATSPVTHTPVGNVQSRIGAGGRKINTRFKPKAPLLRWHERHPEQAAAFAKAEQEAKEKVEMKRQKELQRQIDLQEDQQMQIDDSSEYVIDTYTRMPIDELDAAAKRDSDKIGVLVLDDEDDVETFYREGEGNSEEEDMYDEEDENAENHYTADYPEEEMESDDEFDRNPYKYAKDRDEFTHDAWSDDDVDAMKYPWSTNAERARAKMFRRWVGEESDEEDEDDDDDDDEISGEEENEEEEDRKSNQEKKEVVKDHKEEENDEEAGEAGDGSDMDTHE